MSEKPMRVEMPRTAEMVDAFRKCGLTDNAAILKGLKDGTCWFAENGRYIGLPDARDRSRSESANAIKGDALCVPSKAELDAKQRLGLKGRAQ